MVEVTSERRRSSRNHSTLHKSLRARRNHGLQRISISEHVIESSSKRRPFLAAWLTHSKRRFEEAKTQYQRVLEIDPWHAQALAFLGMVYHLLNETDKAIVKYHEVGSVTTPNRNMHIIISLPISRL